MNNVVLLIIESSLLPIIFKLMNARVKLMMNWNMNTVRLNFNVNGNESNITSKTGFL